MCTDDGVWSGYINEYDGPMDHTAYYFAGLYSVHSNKHE